MKVTVIGGEISDEEKRAYVEHVKKGNPGYDITSLEIKLDGDYVDLRYDKEPIPFNRIRRITGYLVGDLGRFNIAKRKEVDDRLKHGTSEE